MVRPGDFGANFCEVQRGNVKEQAPQTAVTYPAAGIGSAALTKTEGYYHA